MGVFHNFPYVNFHELNLDWILKFTKSVRDRLDTIDEAVTNAKNYSQQSEAWAVGTIDGEAVGQLAPQHENNSKWWAAQASESADNASLYDGYAGQSAYDADQYKIQAMKWATGTGTLPGDPQYENNAKYYADQAASADVTLYGITNIAKVRVPSVKVLASRTFTNSGTPSLTLNIPGLICVAMPFIDTGSSDPLYSVGGVDYRKVGCPLLAAHAIGPDMLRVNKYLIQPLDDGYGGPVEVGGNLYMIRCFTVFDYTTGQFAADNTEFSLELYACCTSYNANGTALNSGTIGT